MKARGAGQPIVLLHPIAMRLEFWDAVGERLKTHFEVISVDLRGHGENPRPATPFSIDDMAQDVIEIVRSLPRGPAIFVGCSMGGMVAQGVAVNAPELVAGLVLANTNHTMGERGAEVMRGRADSAAKGLEITIDQDMARWISEPYGKTHPEMVAKIRSWVLANDARTISLGWRAISNLAYENRLTGVDKPVLVTTGTLDPATRPEAAMKTAAAFRNGRYAPLDDCGHFSPIERPDAFADLVSTFAKDATGRSLT
jgi:3-oxoadipate enol-lactonase